MIPTELAAAMQDWLKMKGVPTNSRDSLILGFFRDAEAAIPKPPIHTIKTLFQLISTDHIEIRLTNTMLENGDKLMEEALERFRRSIHYDWHWTCEVKPLPTGCVVVCKAVPQKKKREQKLLEKAVTNMSAEELDAAAEQIEEMMKKLRSSK